MSSLSDLEIKKIAHLARLEIPENEIAKYQQQISNILAFDKQLDDIDTSQVAPMAHPLDHLAQPLRADVVTESSVREYVMKLAPETVDELFYLVPKVIE